MRQSKELEAKKVRHYFDYQDGQLLRRFSVSGRKAGTIVGWLEKSTGYIRCSMAGEKVYVHRAVWAWHGNPSCGVIDHKDQVKTNNLIGNLRGVNDIVNSRNSKLSKNNTSGTKGVSFDKSRGKWMATAMVNYRPVHLGRFPTKQEAVAARLTYEKEVNWFE